MANEANTEAKIQALNNILSLEYAAFHQYTQHSFLVQGLDRLDFQEYFEDQAKSSSDHARLIGNKIVGYGGVPVIEVATVQQSTDLLTMLEQDLEMEKQLRDAYISAIPFAEADNDVPLKYLLEKQSYEEQKDVEELEKFLSLKRLALAEVPHQTKQVV
jgi:bacterioferritin (cytochrome b1)